MKTKLILVQFVVFQNPGVAQRIRCSPIVTSSVVNQDKKYASSVKPIPRPSCPVSYRDFIYSCSCENCEKQPDGWENSVRCQNHFRGMVLLGLLQLFQRSFHAEATSRQKTITAADLKEHDKLHGIYHEIYNSEWLQMLLSSWKDERASVSLCYYAGSIQLNWMMVLLFSIFNSMEGTPLTNTLHTYSQPSITNKLKKMNKIQTFPFLNCPDEWLWWTQNSPDTNYFVYRKK